MKEKEIKEILDTFEFEDACLSCGDWNKSACYCMNKDPHKCYKVHQIANLFPEPPEEVLLSVDEVCNPKVELCSDLLFHIEELAAIGLIKGDKADEKEYDKRVEELTRGFKIAKAQAQKCQAYYEPKGYNKKVSSKIYAEDYLDE